MKLSESIRPGIPNEKNPDCHDIGYGATAEIEEMIRNEILLRGVQADVCYVTAAEHHTEVAPVS